MPTVASFDVRIGAKIDDFTRAIRRLQGDLRSLHDRIDRDFVRPARDSLRGLDRDVDRFGKSVRKIKVDLDKSLSRETFKIKVKAEIDKKSLAAIRKQIEKAVAAPLNIPAGGGLPGGGGGGGGDSSIWSRLRTPLIIGGIGAAGYGTYTLAKAVIPPLVNYGGPAAAAIYSAPVLHSVHRAAYVYGRDSRQYQMLNRMLASGTIYTTKDTAALINVLMAAGIRSPKAIQKHARRVIDYAQYKDMSLSDAAAAYAEAIRSYGIRGAYRRFNAHGKGASVQDTLYGDFRRLLSEGSRYLDALVISGEPWMRAFMRNLNERMRNVNSLFDLKLMNPRTANTLEGQALKDWRTIRGESWLMTTLRGLLGTSDDPLARKNPLIRFLESKDKGGIIAKYLGDSLEKVDWGKVAESMAKGIGNSDIWKNLGKYIPWEDVGYALGVGMPQMIGGIIQGLMKGGWTTGKTYAKEQLGWGPVGQTLLGVAGAGLMGYLGYRKFIRNLPLIGDLSKKIEESIGKSIKKGLGNIWDKGKNVVVRVTTKGLESLKTLLKNLKNIPKLKSTKVSADTGGATKRVGSLLKSLKSLNRSWKGGRVTTDTGPANSRVGKLRALFRSLNRAWKAGRVNTDTGPATSRLNKLRSLFRALNRLWRAGRIDTNPGPAQGRISKLRSLLRALNRLWRAGRIDTNPGPATGKIRSLRGALRGLNRRWSAGSIDISIGGILKKIGRVRSLLRGLGGGGKKHGGGTIDVGIPRWLGKAARWADEIQPYNPSYQKGEPLGTEFDRWFDAKVRELLRHGGGSIPKAHGGKAFDALTVAGAGTVPVNLWGGEMILTQQQQSWLFNMIRRRREAVEGNGAMISLLQALLAEMKRLRAGGSNAPNIVVNNYTDDKKVGRNIARTVQRELWKHAK